MTWRRGLARSSKRRRLPSAGLTGTSGKDRHVRLPPILGTRRELEFTGHYGFAPRGITRTGADISVAGSPWFVAWDLDRDRMRVVTIIDRLPITIIDGSRGLHTAEVPMASSLDSGLSFRSLLSLGRGTRNAPWISLRPSLIAEHHLVSTHNDLAPNRAPPGLGMANGQARALGCECWFRCAPSASEDAPASRKCPSDR